MDTIYPREGRTENVSQSERIMSIVAGAGMVTYALYRPAWWKTLFALGGGVMIYRGVTGRSTLYRYLNITRDIPYSSGVRVEHAETINRPIAEVYRFWRNFENLARFMEHLQSVQETSATHSHWVAKAPLGKSVEWDAVIESEKPDQWISWRSLPGSQIENSGLVRFKKAPNDKGTEIYVHMEYTPPAGTAGAAVAKLLGEEPDVQIRQDLHRFKQLLEAGEIPTTEGQPSGKRSILQQLT